MALAVGYWGYDGGGKVGYIESPPTASSSLAPSSYPSMLPAKG
jgi:hypothetical protein